MGVFEADNATVPFWASPRSLMPAVRAFFRASRKGLDTVYGNVPSNKADLQAFSGCHGAGQGCFSVVSSVFLQHLTRQRSSQSSRGAGPESHAAGPLESASQGCAVRSVFDTPCIACRSRRGNGCFILPCLAVARQGVYGTVYCCLNRADGHLLSILSV